MADALASHPFAALRSAKGCHPTLADPLANHPFAPLRCAKGCHPFLAKHVRALSPVIVTQPPQSCRAPSGSRDLRKVFLYVVLLRIYNPMQVFLIVQNVGSLAGFVLWIQPGERSL
jgi:hypothetical protein